MAGMFTCVCLGTNDLARAANFYDAAMGALGLNRCDVSAESGWEGWLGWGTYEASGAKQIALWICPPFNGHDANAGNGTMLALQAKSWTQVDAFYAAALANGGSCEGPPGLRPQYNADFYAAYVRDPDGHKLAVICRGITGPT
jgi:catechol 2,3-dioxygenase-like lactoylglutathione lyase family enzyme